MHTIEGNRLTSLPNSSIVFDFKKIVKTKQFLIKMEI